VYEGTVFIEVYGIWVGLIISGRAVACPKSIQILAIGSSSFMVLQGIVWVQVVPSPSRGEGKGGGD